MLNKRRVMIITGSRGEYGYIRPIIKKIEKDERIEHVIVATNMLLLPEFGYAINNFMQDNIEVKYKINMSMSGYSNESMTKSLGIFLQSLTDIVANDRPDIMLLAGDRGEQLVGAIVGAHLNVPVAHVQAGELSGNIDGMTRHAITKFAHIHFASNKDAEKRLLKMGEQEFRVYNTGAPQLDEFYDYEYSSREYFAKEYSFDESKPIAIILQHSVTEESVLSEVQMIKTLNAIIDKEIQAILIFPNNDAGSVGIQDAIDRARKSYIHIKRNINREKYADMMQNADFIIGNSSSGILEAPTFKLPAINIGRRQIGRLQAENVVNVGHDVSEIKDAIDLVLSKEFGKKLEDITNPYGDGKSSDRIIKILKDIEIDSKLLNKELTY